MISWDAPELVVLFSWVKCYHFGCIPNKGSTLLILPGFSSSKTILVEKIILPFPPNNNAYKIYARNLICYLISRDVVDECQLVSSELMYCSVRKRKILCHRPLGHTNHNSIQSLPITNVLQAIQYFFLCSKILKAFSKQGELVVFDWKNANNLWMAQTA